MHEITKATLIVGNILMGGIWRELEWLMPKVVAPRLLVVPLLIGLAINVCCFVFYIVRGHRNNEDCTRYILCYVLLPVAVGAILFGAIAGEENIFWW